MEDKMHDWEYLVAYYMDTHRESGKTGNRVVCILATVVLPVSSL